MTQKPDRNKIKSRLETEVKRLRDDFSYVIEALNKLGSTVAPDDKKEREARAEEYRALEFKGSMVQMQLTLYEIVISHAEYCNYYMDLNDNCHKENLRAIDTLRSDLTENIEKFNSEIAERLDKVDAVITPIVDAKKGFASLKMMTASIVGIIAIISTWLNWAKLFGGAAG